MGLAGVFIWGDAANALCCEHVACSCKYLEHVDDIICYEGHVCV